jgi:HEAT repeat protein
MRSLIVSQPNAAAGGNAASVTLDAATLATLQKALKDQKSLIRADAISFLATTKDAKYADIYLSALNDQSYTVIDNAAEALGETKSPKAYDALLKLSQADSWRSRLRRAGLTGLAALGDKRAFETGYKFATDKNQTPSVRSAALGVVGATGKGDARTYPLIFAQFKKSLDANEFQGIISGINAIAALGDPRGQEAFDLMKTKFKSNPNAMNFINNLETKFKAGIGK